MKNVSEEPLYKNHDFDTVYSDLYAIFSKNFLTFFLVSFAGILLLQVPLFYWGYDRFEMMEYTPGELPFGEGLLNIILFGMIGTFIIYSVLQVFITYYVYRQQRDSSVNFKEILGESIRRYFLQYLVLLIFISLILVVGTVIGILALIIGSFFALLYLGTSVFVSGPAMIIENIGPLRSIKRSFVLTHKDFWSTLGMLFIFVIVLFVLSFILTAIVSIPGAVVFLSKAASGGFAELFTPSNLTEMLHFGIAGILLGAATNALIIPLSPIFSVILYYKLRYKEDRLKPSD